MRGRPFYLLLRRASSAVVMVLGIAPRSVLAFAERSILSLPM